MEGAREREREEVDGLSMRATSWLAWTIWALSMALTMLSLWLLVLGLSRPNVPVYPYWVEGTLGGRLLDSRDCGGLPQAWEPCRLGVVLYRSIVGAYHFSSEYVTYALLAAPGSHPAAKAAAWIYSWLWVPGFGLIVFFGPVVPQWSIAFSSLASLRLAQRLGRGGGNDCGGIFSGCEVWP
jgi:hypothetical protein